MESLRPNAMLIPAAGPAVAWYRQAAHPSNPLPAAQIGRHNYAATRRVPPPDRSILIIRGGVQDYLFAAVAVGLRCSQQESECVRV